MEILGIVGRQNSGKTTLITRLIPALKALGLSVSTVKHSHHGFEIDTPGKDTFRHRESGAEEVMFTSNKRLVLMREIGDGPEHCEEERFRANAQRRSGMEVVVPSGSDAPVTDDAGDEHQG